MPTMPTAVVSLTEFKAKAAQMKFCGTEAAQLDLQRIVTFIAAENPARALAVSEHVE